MLLRKATENETTLSFIKMRSLQRIQFIVLNQQKMRNWEAPNKKKNSIGVSENKILIDATVPFRSLGDMRKEEPRWEGQYRASSAMQKNCIRRQGLLTYTWIITKIYIIQCDLQGNDDIIYTFVNMYITFVTPVMDGRNWDQVYKMGVEILRIWRTRQHSWNTT